MERKWEASKYELNFEKYLTRNGYTFEIVGEYQTTTHYLIEKDGYSYVEVFPHIPIKNMRKYFALIERSMELTKKYTDMYGRK